MGDKEMRELQAQALADAEGQDTASGSNISLSSAGSAPAFRASGAAASMTGAPARAATAAGVGGGGGSFLGEAAAAAARAATSAAAAAMSGGTSRAPMLGRQVMSQPGNSMDGGGAYPRNTLQEPVRETIMRDVRSITDKLSYVMMLRTRTDGCRRLRDWDLWGPLILCLLLGSILSHEATDNDQASYAFADLFVTVWLGSAVVTVNAQLLRAKVSFFQTVCVLGYCIAPLVVAALLVSFYQSLTFLPTVFISLLKVAHVGAGLAWATRASVGFVAELLPDERKMLGVYPVWLFYVAISWMVILI